MHAWDFGETGVYRPIDAGVGEVASDVAYYREIVYHVAERRGLD
jgi:hypothetical protein